MPVSHVAARCPSPAPPLGPALEDFQRFVTARQSAAPVTDFEAFEVELREVLRGVECEILASELARLDMNVPTIEIEGHPARQVHRCEQVYVTAAGKVRVTRSLFRPQGGGRTECPLELRAGIVAGCWTPLAAKQACWVTANLPPKEGAELFKLVGGMSPSASSLDRLPKKVGARWEEDRETFDQLVREEEHVPVEAVSIGVSLDGVMVPMKRDELGVTSSREQRGRRGQNPGTYKEASCASVSYFDADGERLHTVRFARMPEVKKRTLKAMLLEEAGRALAERPDLQLVKIADGARDNWDFLSHEMPLGVEVIDFYHAAEHLRAALEQAYGEGRKIARQQYEKLRLRLRDEVDGVERVIRSLVHLCKMNPRKAKLRSELTYFRRNRHRMTYAVLLEKNLPIGSGVVEASCKTLVTQRLKRSGMNWGEQGGQAILWLRSLLQSERFERGWGVLLSTYRRDVSVPEGVLEFLGQTASRGVSD